MQHAKSAASADVLTDVAIDTSSGYFFLFSANCVHVRGLGVSRHITTPLQHRQVGRYSSPPDTEQMPGSEVGEVWRGNASGSGLRGSDNSDDDWESGGVQKY
jgi:hypothetical protein